MCVRLVWKCYAAHDVELGSSMFVAIRGVKLGRWCLNGKEDVHVDDGGGHSRFGRRRACNVDVAPLTK
jgi:hypothetical protein